MFIHGTSLESCIVAIVVPDEEVLRTYIDRKQVSAKKDDSFEDLCKSTEVKALIMEKIKDKAKELKFNSLEIPKQIHLSHDLFTVENDLLTPTMKSKRHVMRKHFEQEIKQMYEIVNNNITNTA